MARLDAVAAEQVRHGELLAVLTATAEDLMLEVRHLRADQPRRRGTNKQGGRDELIGILVARILVTMSSPLATSWSALLDMLSCGKH